MEATQPEELTKKNDPAASADDFFSVNIDTDSDMQAFLEHMKRPREEVDMPDIGIGPEEPEKGPKKEAALDDHDRQNLAYLDYLDSFRYPLAGEFAVRADVLSDLRIPSDWGLEVGTLSELYRNFATSRICQADILDIYDHKHQALSPEDADAGLAKMSTDIAKVLFRKLAIEGQVLTSETFRTIKASYYRVALDLIEAYSADAVINGLTLDRHAEERAVEVFTESIMRAGEHYLNQPMEVPFIPSWNRVRSALPSLMPRLHAAVEADNA